jgi:hypothetical protein
MMSLPGRCTSHRYAGFAAPPMQDPAAAAAELVRIEQPGFKGALVNGYCRSVVPVASSTTTILRIGALADGRTTERPVLPAPAIRLPAREPTTTVTLGR